MTGEDFFRTISALLKPGQDGRIPDRTGVEAAVETVRAYMQDHDRLRRDVGRLRQALANLAEAACRRENVMGDPCSMIEAKANLSDAATEARVILEETRCTASTKHG